LRLKAEGEREKAEGKRLKAEGEREELKKKKYLDTEVEG